MAIQSWTRAASTHLILHFEQEECLYRVSSPEYHNRNKRQYALEKLAECLQGVRPNTTDNDVRMKISGLQTQFLEADARISSSKKSGSGREDVYKPTLWCYDDLKFLKQHTIQFKGESNIPNAEVALATSQATDQMEPSTSFNRFDDIFEEMIGLQENENEVVVDGRKNTSVVQLSPTNAAPPVRCELSKKRKYSIASDDDSANAIKAMLVDLSKTRRQRKEASSRESNVVDAWAKVFALELKQIKKF